MVKNPPANAGDWVRSLGRHPGEGNGTPLQYSCPENPMDRGALAGYSPWDHKRVRHNLAAKQLLVGMGVLLGVRKCSVIDRGDSCTTENTRSP